jgi:hypothetical protein
VLDPCPTTPGQVFDLDKALRVRGEREDSWRVRRQFRSEVNRPSLLASRAATAKASMSATPFITWRGVRSWPCCSRAEISLQVRHRPCSPTRPILLYAYWLVGWLGRLVRGYIFSRAALLPFRDRCSLASVHDADHHEL